MISRCLPPGDCSGGFSAVNRDVVELVIAEWAYNFGVRHLPDVVWLGVVAAPGFLALRTSSRSRGILSRMIAPNRRPHEVPWPSTSAGQIRTVVRQHHRPWPRRQIRTEYRFLWRGPSPGRLNGLDALISMNLINQHLSRGSPRWLRIALNLQSRDVEARSPPTSDPTCLHGASPPSVCSTHQRSSLPAVYKSDTTRVSLILPGVKMPYQ